MLNKIGYTAFFILVFTVAWENMVLIPGIGTIARLAGMTTVPLCLIYWVAQGRIVFHWFIFWFALFMSWALVSGIWNHDHDSIDKITTGVQLLIFATVILQMQQSPGDSELALKAYLLGCFVAVFSTIEGYVEGTAVVSGRYAAEGFNPNNVSLVIALALPFAWYLLLGRRGWWSLIGLIYLALGLFAILLTGSRGGFILAVVACSYPVLMLAHRPTLRRALGLVGVATTALLFAGIYIVPEESWARIGTIWHEISEGTLNNRTTIWAAGLAAFDQHPFFGVGIGNFQSTVGQSLAYESSAHNVYLSVAVQFGIVGFLIFCATLISAAWGVRRLPVMERRLWYVTLAVLAAAMMSMNLEWSKQTWLFLALAAGHSAAWLHGRSAAKRQQVDLQETYGRVVPSAS